VLCATSGVEWEWHCRSWARKGVAASAAHSIPCGDRSTSVLHSTWAHPMAAWAQEGGAQGSSARLGSMQAQPRPPPTHSHPRRALAASSEASMGKGGQGRPYCVHASSLHLRAHTRTPACTPTCCPAGAQWQPGAHACTPMSCTSGKGLKRLRRPASRSLLMELHKT